MNCYSLVLSLSHLLYKEASLSSQIRWPNSLYHFRTVGSDAMSYVLSLANRGATFVLHLQLVMILFIEQKGLWTNLFYYWVAVAIIRCMRTAFGDFCAHTMVLLLATITSGATFIGVIWLIYYLDNNNVRLNAQEFALNSQTIDS